MKIREHTVQQAFGRIKQVNKSCLTPVLVAVMALSFGGCRGEAQTAGVRSSRAVDFYACGKSADCVIENQRDCCPCNAGGKQLALNKKRVGAYRAARAARCVGDLLCPQMYICDDKARAVCRAGRCELVPGRVQPAALPPPGTASPPAPVR